MSVSQLQKKFEAEMAQIDEKIGALQARKEVVALVLKEMGGARRSLTRGAAGPPRTAKKKRKGKSMSGVTVKDAILQVVSGSNDPLTPADIIASAGKLSGGATTSIRTQINALAKAKLIRQVPYEGRGFQYAAAAGKSAGAETASYAPKEKAGGKAKK